MGQKEHTMSNAIASTIATIIATMGDQRQHDGYTTITERYESAVVIAVTTRVIDTLLSSNRSRKDQLANILDAMELAEACHSVSNMTFKILSAHDYSLQSQMYVDVLHREFFKFSTDLIERVELCAKEMNADENEWLSVLESDNETVNYFSLSYDSAVESSHIDTQLIYNDLTQLVAERCHRHESVNVLINA